MTKDTATHESTSSAIAAVLPGAGIELLIRLKLRVLRNRIFQAAREQPLKIAGTVASILVIWLGMYTLLVFIFHEVRRQVLEGIVAMPLIFAFFFLALSGMLAFSTAILSYGAMFRHGESMYLMASPLPPRHIVMVRYFESLLLASWSLLLLGIPLMLAIGRAVPDPWTFCPLFLGLFLLFIPIPGALGLLLAWAVAMVAPKTPRKTLLLVALLLGAVGVWWMWKILSMPVSQSEWLKVFYDRVSVVQNAVLPHTWVSKGINHARQGQTGRAGFYLFVTLANALFASVVAVAVVSRGFISAFARAQTSGARSVRRRGRALSWIGEVLFAYLPGRQRLLAAKDLKTFFRDPLQWTQMAILFGLLALYVSNVQRLWPDLGDHGGLKLLIAFLNLVTVSLILATFTTRFVFPLVSLEGQQLWLLGLLPLPRSRMIIAKFLYALTITLLASLTVMGISVRRLDLPLPLAATHVAGSVAICIGLCGLSIGMGARMPLFAERNPARIAGGFGGTVSLLMSVALVVLSLAGIGVISVRAAQQGYGDVLTSGMLWWLIGVIILNLAVACLAMTLGIRHFNRAQF